MWMEEAVTTLSIVKNLQILTTMSVCVLYRYMKGSTYLTGHPSAGIQSSDGLLGWTIHKKLEIIPIKLGPDQFKEYVLAI